MTGWGLRNLTRRPLRTALSVGGIAVAAALLLDMVMLSGGIEQSFARMLLGRGYQVRITPKGTLPFDAEATIARVGPIVARLRADPAVAAAGAVLGANVYAHHQDSLISLVGYGIEPEAQAMYTLEIGTDLQPTDSTGILLSSAAAAALGASVGDTVRLAGRPDPQTAGVGTDRPLAVRAIVHWMYDYRGQRSAGLTLEAMQQLLDRRAQDPGSLIMVRLRDGIDVAPEVAQLRAAWPGLEVSSFADLVAAFHTRMLYFRQLSYILGTVSLIVTVLLVGTLLTITVNERLGEIATLRAIGVSRGRVVRQVLAEGAALTAAGALLGGALGLATARYLDAILTSFPGLPAAFSFFVPRADTITVAAVILLVTGCVAGLYPAWLAAGAPIAPTLRSEAT